METINVAVNKELIEQRYLFDRAVFKLDICPVCGADLKHYTITEEREHKYTSGMLWWKEEKTRITKATVAWRMCCSTNKEHLDMNDKNAYWRDAAISDFGSGF